MLFSCCANAVCLAAAAVSVCFDVVRSHAEAHINGIANKSAKQWRLACLCTEKCARRKEKCATMPISDRRSGTWNFVDYMEWHKKHSDEAGIHRPMIRWVFRWSIILIRRWLTGHWRWKNTRLRRESIIHPKAIAHAGSLQMQLSRDSGLWRVIIN